MPTAPAAAASSSAGFWLPPGMEAETQRLNDALKSVGTTATERVARLPPRWHHRRGGVAEADDQTSKFVVTLARSPAW